MLERRTYFKELLKKIPKENIEEAFWCEGKGGLKSKRKYLFVCMAPPALYGTDLAMFLLLKRSTGWQEKYC